MHSDDEYPTDFSIRRADPADRAAILEVCRVSLGWDPEDPNESFFAWKHDQNACGASPIWVAGRARRLGAGRAVFHALAVPLRNRSIP